MLADYVRTGSEAAFRELVSRYIDLVHSTAVRLVEGDIHRAKDVAQMVFLDLARMAPKFSKNVMLGGWLHRHTCFVAANTMRGERRRQSREREAVEMNALQSNSRDDFELVAPILDEAINELAEADRTAILLRFFEQDDFRSVGRAIGSNEDAARMRVTRALEKLEGLLKDRGVTASAGALSGVLSAHAVEAAPAGLAISISSIAAGAVPAAQTSAAFATTKTIAMSAFQKAIAASALAAAIGTAIYEGLQASISRRQVQTLEQQQTSLAEQIQQLQQERDDAKSRLTSLAEDKGGDTELLRLRAEVARLRMESKELAKVKAQGTGTDRKSLVEDAESLIDRVRLLKERLAQTPGARIPELQFLTEEDWLRAAAGRQKLETDADFQAGFSDLRDRSEGRFLLMMETPLQKYIEANKQFPMELSQLKAYAEKAISDEILERYQIVPANTLPVASAGRDAGDYLITLKSPEEGGQQALGRNGHSGFVNSEPMAILAPAMRAMAEDTPEIDGKKTMDMRNLGPYLKTPEQKAAYQRLMENRKP